MEVQVKRAQAIPAPWLVWRGEDGVITRVFRCANEDQAAPALQTDFGPEASSIWRRLRQFGVIRLMTGGTLAVERSKPIGWEGEE